MTDSLFAEICTKHSHTVVTTVFPRSVFVVALRVRSLAITGVSIWIWKKCFNVSLDVHV